MVNRKLILSDLNRLVKEAQAIRNRWKRRVAKQVCNTLRGLLTTN